MKLHRHEHIKLTAEEITNLVGFLNIFKNELDGETEEVIAALRKVVKKLKEVNPSFTSHQADR